MAQSVPQQLGVRPVINASATLTKLGGSIMPPEVVEAMSAASTSFVDMHELLRKAGKELRYFRHPFLHTGLSGETRRKFESFLKERGYVVAPVTVDNYDYQFAAAYDRAVASDDGDVRQKVVRSYLEYMEAVVAYYEQQSAAIIEREIAQTLLLHANALNAATIDRLAVMLKRRGYRFVSLGDALKDPAYQSADAYYGPAGITWLHRWALTQGKKGTFFAGEPAVPEWIELAAR